MVLGTAIGTGLFDEGTNGALTFFGCSTRLLVGVAGDEVAEFPLGAGGGLDACLPRGSSIDAWSTG